jgi:hypothetical protein
MIGRTRLERPGMLSLYGQSIYSWKRGDESQACFRPGVAGMRLYDHPAGRRDGLRVSVAERLRFSVGRGRHAAGRRATGDEGWVLRQMRRQEEGLRVVQAVQSVPPQSHRSVTAISRLRTSSVASVPTGWGRPHRKSRGQFARQGLKIRILIVYGVR